MTQIAISFYMRRETRIISPQIEIVTFTCEISLNGVSSNFLGDFCISKR